MKVVAPKLFHIEGEHLCFIKTWVLCCVERCWWLVALTTAPLGFVLFVARCQCGCLLFQDCGPKVWVLNEALNLHNVKSTSGWAQYVRRGTENVKVAEGNKLLGARENPVSFRSQVDLVLHWGDLIFVFFFFAYSIYKTWDDAPSPEKCWMQTVINQPRFCFFPTFCLSFAQKQSSVTMKWICLWENKWMLGLVFCRKLLMCMCSGVGGEMNRALNFSGMCLPSNSFISSS